MVRRQSLVLGSFYPYNRPMDKKIPKRQIPQNKKAPNFITQLFSIILLLMAVSFVYGEISKRFKGDEQVSLSQVARLVENSEVKSIEVYGSKVSVILKDDSKKKAIKEPEAGIVETLKNYGVSSEKIGATDINVKTASGLSSFFFNVFPILLPIILVGFLIWMLTRQVKGQGMQAFSFGQSKAKMTSPDDPKNQVTFKDVAGAREAKQELAEIVDFLKNPQKFLEIGAEIPKGVLLTGAPGTGKTLLARAVAGEAGVPFFHLSGSEFVEMFVGVGASRVRDLFQTAKRSAPAIIFVDEIDAVGRVRGFGMGGGNDEREQTLNQILVEMDGFEPNEKVIVMAATNRSDVLDPALLRPGRFDRRVVLDLPDRRDREEILMLHAKKKPLAEDVNIALISERTPGFSGADLYSLMNEAAILTARENRKKVAQFDLIRSIEKVMLGPERRSHLMNEAEKKITAYHEGGHAVLASVLPFADPVHKVTIIPRGNAGGYTLKLPLEDRKLQSKNEFLDDIVVSLGGFVAEEMTFGDTTTGPSNDLQVSSNLARAMVTRFGMSEELGPIAFESNGGRPMFGHMEESKVYSEEWASKIDEEVSKIMNESLKKARKILSEKKEVLDAVAQKLIEVETLEQKEYEEILSLHGIPLKKKAETPPLS